MPIPLLFDTDIGSDVDDAVALGVTLAARDEIDLVALTTVAADTQGRARAAARMLGLAGRSDVEVHVGAEQALARENAFVWREIETKGYPDGPDAPISDEPAPERIVRAANEIPELEIAAIGPMTNLARALAIDPELPRKVKRLIIMGGHVREVKIGDFVCAPGIDYNLCSDPAASVTVLGAGFETRLVTADVTLRCWLRSEDIERLERAPGPIAPLIASLVRIWTPFQHKVFTALGGTLAPDNAAYLHDPLTLLSLVDESALRFERLRIVPTIEDGVLRTLEVDPSLGIGAEMEVATGVEPDAARDAVVERLLTV